MEALKRTQCISQYTGCFYHPQRSCVKVMFLHMSLLHMCKHMTHVISSHQTPSGQTPTQADPPPPLAHTRAHTSWADTPLPSYGHCSRRYASYWNAFLFVLC